MSDLNEGPDELPPELRGFYDAHGDTGEPTGAQLGKALLRLHTGTRPAAPMTLSSRRWLPPELLAVAALLVVTVGGAGIGWYLKAQSVATNEAMAEARRAWVTGDLDAAVVSLERCSSAECTRLAAAVKRAKPQLAQEAIDPAERGSLLALDLELSGDQQSVIALRLQPRPAESDDDFAKEQTEALVGQGFSPDVSRRAVALFIAALEVSASSPDLATRNFREVVSLVPGTLLARRAEKRTQLLVSPEPAPSEPVVEPVVVPPPAPAPDEAVKAQTALLLAEGKAAKKERRYRNAMKALNRCLELSPGDVECTVALASTYAMKATDENDAFDGERARSLYRTFLRIAPPDDKRRTRVQEILHEQPDEPVVDERALELKAHDLYLRGYQLREAAPEEARRVFEEVVRLSPDSVDGQKARNRLEELPARRGPVARLRIASNPTAARVFVDGVDTGRITPVLPSAPLEVAPGRHTISAELGGQRSAPQRLSVVEGDNPVIKLFIE